MIFNPDKGSYTAETTSFFLQKTRLEFKPEDVKVPDVPGMFTSLLAKGKPLFLDPRMFSNPEHYIKIMGYDKPIDFKLETVDSEDSKDGMKK